MPKLTLAWIVLAALALPARAADAPKEAPKSSWKSFFETLVKSLDRSTASRFAKGNVRVVAVAAVRGAGQTSEDPLAPYWKGGWSEKAAEGYKKETEEFRAAAQLLLDGKPDESIAGLKAFKAAHPKSSLLPDVEDALKQAQTAKGEMSASQAPVPPGGDPPQAEPSGDKK